MPVIVGVRMGGLYARGRGDLPLPRTRVRSRATRVRAYAGICHAVWPYATLTGFEARPIK